ncbi:E3 ubiquitin-protein ligase RNF166-like [Liolophura sinensis]|uniref:E3 ubiquitin-protein ligase RNF166-like n=1 Tax=Liolophura sinensis TaxID=3198878 RepID=UPI0031590330
MKMASGSSKSKLKVSPSEMDSVTCSICLDIYEKPMKIACGHRFCEHCIKPYSSLSQPQCPLCRQLFDPKSTRKDSDLKKFISSSKGQCTWCGKEMSLSKLRSHSSSCSKMDKSVPHFQPVAHTSQPIPNDVPNRSTFQCPYCGLKNLDTHGLVKHCNEQHQSGPSQLTCPICSAMPWGDPNRKSSNFIQHLNLRHKFEYDTFVDFAQDDDTMLQAALQASLQEFS